MWFASFGWLNCTIKDPACKTQWDVSDIVIVNPVFWYTSCDIRVKITKPREDPFLGHCRYLVVQYSSILTSGLALYVNRNAYCWWMWVFLYQFMPVGPCKYYGKVICNYFPVLRIMPISTRYTNICTKYHIVQLIKCVFKRIQVTLNLIYWTVYISYWYRIKK